MSDSEGYLFGKKSCYCGCELCETGILPETVTVTLTGYDDYVPGDWLVALSATACHGDGFAGRVTAPHTTAGPISAAAITAAGSGYAKMARVSPALSVAAPAVFALVLTADTDACAIDYWRVSSVTVTPGGSGYADGDPLAVIVGAGSTEEVAAVLVIRTARSAPTVTATSAPGTGANLTVATASLGGSPETWQVTTIAVVDGGSDHIDGDPVQFTYAAGDVETTPPAATIRTVRAAPTVTATVDPGSAGSGAVLGVTLTSGGSPTTWSVTALSITTPGTGYTAGEGIDFAVTVGQENFSGGGTITSVNGSGGITGVSIGGAGEYWLDTGVIDTVTVDAGGVAYHVDDEPASVEVIDGGIYYEEDAAGAPYVAAVTVVITQTAPSAGTGATITATVDSNTASGTFGKITSLAITVAGTAYLAYELVHNACCGARFNGIPIVLKRANTPIELPGSLVRYEGNQCYYSHCMCGGYTVPRAGVSRYGGGVYCVQVQYRGPSLSPIVTVFQPYGASDEWNAPTPCIASLTTETLITDCYALAFTATDVDGRTAVVTSGGDYDRQFMGNGSVDDPLPAEREGCSDCCQGAEDVPEEITVRASNLAGPNAVYNGDHVLVRTVNTLNWYSSTPETSAIILVISREACTVGGPCVGFECLPQFYGFLISDGAHQTLPGCVSAPNCRPAIGTTAMGYSDAGKTILVVKLEVVA